MLAATDSADEAHYVCAALNSIPARAFIAAYTVETQISTHVLRNLRVPRFDPARKEHTAIAVASKAAHAAVAEGEIPDQGAVDVAAAKLWGLTKKEIAATRGFLDSLLKRDLA